MFNWINRDNTPCSVCEEYRSQLTELHDYHEKSVIHYQKEIEELKAHLNKTIRVEVVFPKPAEVAA